VRAITPMPMSDEPAQVTVPPEIDLTVAPALRDALVAHARATGADEIPLDFSGVTFIDSGGLQALIDVTKATGKRLRLLDVPPACRRVFEITDTARLFGIT
jgi:anti-anti-sigma factor